MDNLQDFRDMVNDIDDPSLLESGQSLLRELMEINSLKETLKKLESGLTDGQKAVFYFFAENLSEDELPFAAERLTGRLKRVRRSIDSKSALKKKEE
jgi:hypothetical protein